MFKPSICIYTLKRRLEEKKFPLNMITIDFSALGQCLFRLICLSYYKNLRLRVNRFLFGLTKQFYLFKHIASLLLKK